MSATLGELRRERRRGQGDALRQLSTARGGKWAGLARVVVLVTAVAVISSIPMPRGPVTTAQGLLVIAVSLLAGMIAGYALRSRWAFLLAPLGYMAAYELSRFGLAGASVGFPRLESINGIAAFAFGRGVHGLLALVPMVAGIAVGRALARPRHRVTLASTGLPSVAVAALAVLVAWPASTPPVLGPDGQPVVGSIAELTRVEIGGREQGLLIRAADPEKPVLLYLSGGPGQSDLAFGRALLEPLVHDFVVVVWDQRGSGTSYGALDPTSALTLGRAVSDTIELTNHLRERFDERKIYLLGESWGSTLGVLAVQQRPDLFHAYVGSGQMVSQRVTDQVIWRDLLALAERTKDWQLYDRVLALGEPPYRDMPWANSFVMGFYAVLETPYVPPEAYIRRFEAAGIGPFFGILGSEYSFIDKANAVRGLVDVFSLMYPQLQEVDFRTDVPELAVPVWILDGANELRARREIAHQWFEQLRAPRKNLVTWSDAGHAVVFEQADAFRQLMVKEIVPSTYDVEAG